METRFQTSFIPKRPLSVPGSPSARPSSHHSLGGIFMTIAVVIFILSLVSVGGAYLWKGYLTSAQASYRSDLANREKQFKPELIQQLEQQSMKINLAKQVLAGHIAASQVFSVIGALTAERVRFLSLDFNSPTTPGTGAKVSLTGYGQSLSTVAFQSDVLNTLSQYGLSNIVKNPMLSNPALNGDGTVAFSLSATIDPSVLSYQKYVTGSVASSSSSTI